MDGYGCVNQAGVQERSASGPSGQGTFREFRYSHGTSGIGGVGTQGVGTDGFGGQDLQLTAMVTCGLGIGGSSLRARRPAKSLSVSPATSRHLSTAD